MSSNAKLTALLADGPECGGIDATAYVRNLRKALTDVDTSISVSRAMAESNRPERPLVGFIVKLDAQGGMGRTTFTRWHWAGVYSTVASAIVGAVTSSWGVGVFLLANSVVVLWKLREPIEGLQAQVLYEVCLSCNDSQAHDLLGTTLLTNLEDSRSRHRVEYPELNQNTFDAAVDALLNKGILRPGREPRSLRLGERVVEADGGWL